MKLLGSLAFVVALLLSVMFHELGHYLTARKFGMKVTEFFLGFGKRIWSFRKGETEYGIKAIPAGGYCRIEGMTPRDEMPEGEESRAFIKASSLKKLIVLGAGSFNHLVVGFLLLFVFFFGIGYSAPTSTIDVVTQSSAAEAAGIKSGDRITAINSQEIVEWADVVAIISKSQGEPLQITIERGSTSQTISATPTYAQEYDRYLLGITSDFQPKKEGFVTSLSNAGTSTWSLIKASASSMVHLPQKLPDLFRQTFMGEKRDAEGLVGVVGAARVSGDVVASDLLDANESLGAFVLMVASLNIFVALFNLLPILPLDGGHMAVAIADEVRALFARIRRRPRPAPIDVNVLTPITMIVFVGLTALTVLLLIADIFNPISLNL